MAERMIHCTTSQQLYDKSKVALENVASIFDCHAWKSGCAGETGCLQFVPWRIRCLPEIDCLYFTDMFASRSPHFIYERTDWVLSERVSLRANLSIRSYS